MIYFMSLPMFITKHSYDKSPPKFRDELLGALPTTRAILHFLRPFKRSSKGIYHEIIMA